MKKEADSLYEKLLAEGYDVLLDDRAKSPGVKFADADLIGASLRIVVSSRNLENSQFEVKASSDEEAKLIDKENIFEYIKEERIGM